jgi:single-strand DNA-binding protein
MAGKSVNKVTLLGHLGKDPEMKYTPQGTPVVKFSMATNERWKDKNGEWQDRAEWHNLVAWQRLAEIISEYCHKGSQLYVEGRLQTRSWDDKETKQKKYMTEIVVNEIVLLGGKGNGGDSDRGEGNYQREGFDQTRSARGGSAVTEDNPITDEDIPFILQDFSVLECPASWMKRKYV